MKASTSSSPTLQLKKKSGPVTDLANNALPPGLSVDRRPKKNKALDELDHDEFAGELPPASKPLDNAAVIAKQSFHDLGLIPEICETVERLGYQHPTPIQSEAIPLILEGNDLIGIAQTGTGKTGAFMLPLLDSLVCEPSARPRRARALVLTPTRELAVQIQEAATGFAKGLRLRAVVIYGGVNQRLQERELSKGVDVIIATPGRLNDLIEQGIISLSGVEFLVLDEADRMLDMGFLPQLKHILTLIPKERQTLMFSATLSKEIEKLAQNTMNAPAMIEVGARRKPAEGITQSIYSVMRLKKPDLLLQLLTDMERSATLIFTRTRHDANRVAHVLEHAGVKVTKMHSDLNQNQRTRALAGFKGGRFDTLVATDVAARGLDVQNISHVINYEPPMSPDDYVHRIGRTARADRKGEAITLVAPEEEPLMRRIEKSISMRINRIQLEGFAPLQSSRGGGSGEPRPSRGRGGEGRSNQDRKTQGRPAPRGSYGEGPSRSANPNEAPRFTGERQGKRKGGRRPDRAGSGVKAGRGKPARSKQR